MLNASNKKPFWSILNRFSFQIALGRWILTLQQFHSKRWKLHLAETSNSYGLGMQWSRRFWCWRMWTFAADTNLWEQLIAVYYILHTTVYSAVYSAVSLSKTPAVSIKCEPTPGRGLLLQTFIKENLDTILSHPLVELHIFHHTVRRIGKLQKIG